MLSSRKEDLEKQIKPYIVRSVVKGKRSIKFNDQLSGVWGDIENGDITNVGQLRDALKSLSTSVGKNLIVQYFSDDPTRFAQVADGKIKIVSERKQRKLLLLRRV